MIYTWPTTVQMNICTFLADTECVDQVASSTGEIFAVKLLGGPRFLRVWALWHGSCDEATLHWAFHQSKRNTWEFNVGLCGY
jgi:hypothetical protein